MAVSILVKVGERLLVGDELLLQPGAVLQGKIFKHLGGAIPVNLAHNSRISIIGPARSLAAGNVTTFGTC